MIAPRIDRMVIIYERKGAKRYPDAPPYRELPSFVRTPADPTGRTP